jgi:hypothetical protein
MAVLFKLVTVVRAPYTLTTLLLAFIAPSNTTSSATLL